MRVILASNHGKAQDWLNKEFRYVGSVEELQSLDWDQIEQVLYAPCAPENDLYWSDEHLRLQMRIAARRKNESKTN